MKIEHTNLNAKKKLLITGAAGRIGSLLSEGLKEKYYIRGFDRRAGSQTDEHMVGDLNDYETVKKAAQDMDIIIHLGGNPSGYAPWDDALSSNIVGTYNLFEAAVAQGVKRVIFASTVQVTFGYGNDPFTSKQVPKPINHYGVSKVTGEMLGHMYAHRYGLEVLCIRIGRFGDNPNPNPAEQLGIYFSPRDCLHLFERALKTEEIGFEIVYGVSNNKHCPFDLAYTKQRLNYQPLDSELES